MRNEERCYTHKKDCITFLENQFRLHFEMESDDFYEKFGGEMDGVTILPTNFYSNTKRLDNYGNLTGVVDGTEAAKVIIEICERYLSEQEEKKEVA